MRKWDPSKNRYSSEMSDKSRVFQASKSTLMASQTRLTVDLDSGRLGPESVGQGGLHVTHRQTPHEPGDDQALQGVGAAHPTPKSPDANTSSVHAAAWAGRSSPPRRWS